MTRDDAQNILQLCRPDHIEDLKNPLISEAMELLEQDSELRAWFEEQQRLDTEIYAEFSRIQPPQGLKSSILNGIRLQSTQPEVMSQTDSPKHSIASKSAGLNPVNTNNPSRVFWFRPWMGIAAVFIFASVLLIVRIKRPSPPSPAAIR